MELRIARQLTFHPAMSSRHYTKTARSCRPPNPPLRPWSTPGIRTPGSNICTAFTPDIITLISLRHTRRRRTPINMCLQMWCTGRTCSNAVSHAAGLGLSRVCRKHRLRLKCCTIRSDRYNK